MEEKSIFKIDGVAYDVIVTAITESFSILYSGNTGRTIAQGAPMTLDPLGTFISHNVTVRRKLGQEKEFDALYDYLLIPHRVGINVEIVHNQDVIKYKAYVSTGQRSVKKVDIAKNKVYWGDLKLNIVPIRAQVLP